ncbi:MAG: 7-carboxy-7-deazaguanine synthase QueE [Elusimicrobiota bacterium]|jgi:organic radical activating enzyme|nr:7-carboxy-7-deazaguanine synthase QueE [Elusimicrobiota bacterium]
MPKRLEKKADGAAEIGAPISEIFFSYQGEGPYAGMAQIFIRFAGCNLRCNYCDTPQGFIKNPEIFSVERLIKKVLSVRDNNKKKFNTKKPYISLTGGEPLLHIIFLRKFLAEITKLGFNIYLQSNGVLCESLKQIIKFVDIISMDIKLYSACKLDFLTAHKLFLSYALRSRIKDIFVKCVITKDTEGIEILEAAKAISTISKSVLFILQPSTDRRAAGLDKLFICREIAVKFLKNVYPMAQLHKIYKVR